MAVLKIGETDPTSLAEFQHRAVAAGAGKTTQRPRRRAGA